MSDSPVAYIRYVRGVIAVSALFYPCRSTASRFTGRVVGTLLTALRAGVAIEAACRSAGISLRTYHRWCDRGEKDTVGPYAVFREAAKVAEAEGELRRIRRERHLDVGRADADQDEIP